MDLLKILKCLVFIISFVMFCYQLNIATINLMNPGLVDINHERVATGDDMPLITVCPTNQMKYTRLKELGYDGFGYILSGHTKCNETAWCKSWGGHLNLTFDELKEQVLDLDKVKRMHILIAKYKESSVFIPAYGMCQETTFLNDTQKIVLYHVDKDDARVFITNRNYRSFIMPDAASHVGKEIFMKKDTRSFINVKIQERNLCTNDKKPMTELEFKKCVDDKIQHEFLKNNIKCVPPWLSYNKQCNLTYPNSTTFYGKLKKDMFNYVNMVVMFRNIRFEDECRQSCKETTYVVDRSSKVMNGTNFATIFFDQNVIVTERVQNYDMFKYIIDVGSSLGLWLGLSVLGLHDLVVWAVQFVNNSFIIKKIRSAVTK